MWQRSGAQIRAGNRGLGDPAGWENAPDNAATSCACSSGASTPALAELLEAVDAAITALDAGEVRSPVRWRRCSTCCEASATSFSIGPGGSPRVLIGLCVGTGQKGGWRYIEVDG